MAKHCGASLGPQDPWFAEHAYTVRLHCKQWLRIYLGGMAEAIIEEPEEKTFVRHIAMP